MDIQSRKIEFIQEFLKIQSEDVLAQFERLMKKEQVPKTEKPFRPMSVSELNERIDKSENDFKKGKYKTSAELTAKYK